MNKKESPLPGAFYRQKEGSLYQVRCVAADAAGGEMLVICQKLSADFGLVAYRFSQFAKQFSEVALTEKEAVAGSEVTEERGAESSPSDTEQGKTAQLEATVTAGESEAALHAAGVSQSVRAAIPEPEPEERDLRFLHFLELQSPRERRIYLEEERDNLTVRDILRIATALEIEDSGEPEDQLRNAFAALRMQERYEKERGDRHV